MLRVAIINTKGSHQTVPNAKKIVVYGTQSFRKIIKGAFEILKIQKTVQDENYVNDFSTMEQ